MPDPTPDQPVQSVPQYSSTISALAARTDSVPAAGGMQVTVRPDGDVDVVVLVGELDFATVPELASTIDGQLIQGRNRIVLDLDAVTFFDARAIDAVITATCAAALTGGRLFITHNPHFMLLLKLKCETHRVNVTEALRTAGPEQDDVRSGTPRGPEPVHAAQAIPDVQTETVDEGTRLARDTDLAALLKRSADGDQSAFAAVYDATAARAYGLGVLLLRDPTLAAETVQEAYLHIWEQAARFQSGQGSAFSWILTTVHRCAVARVRSVARRVAPDDLNGETRTSPACGMAGKLSSVQRRSVELAYFEGYTHTEVEHVSVLPIGTGQTQLRDGLLQLDDRRRAG